MSALSNGSSGCSDDSRGVCAAAPSLASRVCRATCGVCDGYGVPPDTPGRAVEGESSNTGWVNKGQLDGAIVVEVSGPSSGARIDEQRHGTATPP